MEPTPIPIPAKTPELAALFFAQVSEPDPETGCQYWTGPRYQHGGYGRFYIPGDRSYRAHRIAYAWKYGDTPLTLDHTCHNPLTCKLDEDGWCSHRLCVNPDHLDPTTRGENVRRGLPGSPLWSPVGNSNKKLSASGREFDYVDPRGWRGNKKDRAEATKRYYDRNREAINARKRAEREHVTYDEQPCQHCGGPFTPKYSTGRYCQRRDCINSRKRENRLKRIGRQ